MATKRASKVRDAARRRHDRLQSRALALAGDLEALAGRYKKAEAGLAGVLPGAATFSAAFRDAAEYLRRVAPLLNLPAPRLGGDLLGALLTAKQREATPGKPHHRELAAVFKPDAAGDPAEALRRQVGWQVKRGKDLSAGSPLRELIEQKLSPVTRTKRRKK